MTKAPLLLLSLLLTAGVARTASAAVCVQLDASRDNLPEPDRAATLTLLTQALQQQGQEVTSQGCAGTYVVYHVRLGASVTVFMQGPQGYRQATARALEEIPAVYSQMIHSLLSGQPMGTANGTVDRTNATSAQQAPTRVEADSLWYLRLGYAGATGPITNSGPAFGFGYRYELDSMGIDVSFLNFMFSSNDRSSSTTSSGSAGVTGSWVKLMGLYFLNPTANGSSYLAGGVSWGGTVVGDNTRVYSGSGLQGEVSGGYEFLRASTIRMFAQADVTLPFYAVSTSSFDVAPVQKSWAPTFTVSVGLGWGKSINRVHIVQ